MKSAILRSSFYLILAACVLSLLSVSSASEGNSEEVKPLDDGWVPLFNGKDLSGWKMSGKGNSEWKVENGILITPGEGPELINDSKFEDFKLHVEFNCGPTSTGACAC